MQRHISYSGIVTCFLNLAAIFVFSYSHQFYRCVSDVYQINTGPMDLFLIEGLVSVLNFFFMPRYLDRK